MTNNDRINDRIDEVHEYVKRHINEIDNIKNNILKSICLFSLVECFAQEYCEYTRENADNFIRFINDFSEEKIRDLLNKIDPITLFYEKEKKFIESKSNITLDYIFSDMYPYYTWEHIPEFPESKHIIQLACDKLKKKHTYAQLLYKYRSKLSHEMASPSSIADSMHDETKPLYHKMYRFCDPNDKGRWYLVFPYSFLKNLFTPVIIGFLEKRRELGLDPFENKKDYYHWYE